MNKVNDNSLYFYNTHPDKISTKLNLSLLRQYQSLVEVQQICEVPSSSTMVIMGYALRELTALRDQRPDLRIGVIDPRPSFEHQPVGCDFILTNGIEMMDWYRQFTPNLFFYPIYPQLCRSKETVSPRSSTDTIILGYHGNKIHLMEMFPRITQAIEALADHFSVELWVMYNIDKLGMWRRNLPKGVRVNHLQWSEEGYDQYMSQVDIGIIPALLPSDNKRRWKYDRTLNQHASDYALEFKATSNLGRAFVFFQYGIPVVADMIPSALQLMRHEEEGFVCKSSASWFDALYQLCASSEKRKQVSDRMTARFESEYAVEAIHKKLTVFLQQELHQSPHMFWKRDSIKGSGWGEKIISLFYYIKQRYQ